MVSLDLLPLKIGGGGVEKIWRRYDHDWIFRLSSILGFLMLEASKHVGHFNVLYVSKGPLKYFEFLTKSILIWCL